MLGVWWLGMSYEALELSHRPMTLIKMKQKSVDNYM